MPCSSSSNSSNKCSGKYAALRQNIDDVHFMLGQPLYTPLAGNTRKHQNPETLNPEILKP